MEKEMSFINTVLTITNDEPASATLPSAIPKYIKSGRKPLDEKISKIFLAIGIPAHITGYHYLREAVKLAAGNFEMIKCITTKLYPLVASRFNTDTCKVERGIRNAIEIAWHKGKIIHLNNIFGIIVYEQNDKPSSGELIALLAERIYLDGI